VATVVVGKWCRQVDHATLQQHLSCQTAEEANEPEKAAGLS
jgi:hypothetical protein